LILSRFQDLKYDEIAQLLGCEVGTVKTRVHRALQDLRQIFQLLEGGKVRAEEKILKGWTVGPTRGVAMKCEEIAELLPDYLQGRLVLDQASLVEEHVRGCVPCGEEACTLAKAWLSCRKNNPVQLFAPASKPCWKVTKKGAGRRAVCPRSEKKGPALWGLGNWLQARQQA